MLTKEEKQLIILNHSSRELLQLMVMVKMQLKNCENQTTETEKLHSTINLTWEAIERQIENISRYLKVDEDILQAYSWPKPRAENSTWKPSSSIACTNDDLKVDTSSDLDPQFL